MPLELVPALTDMDIQAIEAHVDAKRQRRLTAAIIYQQGINAKLAHQHSQIERRIHQQARLLEKEIIRFDKAAEAVDKKLEKLTVLMQQAGLVSDLFIQMPDED